MGGIVGRLFHEFAMTLSIAILMSLVVSLTTTPMMCAISSCATHDRRTGLTRLALFRAVFERAACRFYGRTPELVAATIPAHHARPAGHHRGSMSISMCIVPKGFFPSRTPAGMIGGIAADQSISFQAMQQKFEQFDGHRQGRSRRCRPWSALPAAAAAAAGGRPTPAMVFVTLKPLRERGCHADEVIARLRAEAARCRARGCSCRRAQDIRAGGRRATAPTSTPCGRHAGRAQRLGCPRSPMRCRMCRKLDGRQFRPAGQGAGDRPRRSTAPPRRGWASRRADRQHAVRRLRPAPGVDHLQGQEPVSCGHGGGARASGRARRR